MNCLGDGTGNVEHEFINRTIIDGNLTSVSLIITKGNYSFIDADNNSCHSYYTFRFYSSTYTPQSDLNIDGQVIFSDVMVCEGTYYFAITTNYHS